MDVRSVPTSVSPGTLALSPVCVLMVILTTLLLTAAVSYHGYMFDITSFISEPTRNEELNLEKQHS